MSWFNIIVYLSSILANLIFGLVVFFRNPKNITNRFFALFTLPLAGWLMTLFILANSSSYQLVSLSARLNSAFLILIGYALFYFAYYFPKKTFKLTSLLNVAFTLETFGLILLSLLTLEITEVGLVVGERLTAYGRLYPLFVIHFLIYSGSALLILLSKREKFKGFPRAQIDCLLFGFSGALSFGMLMHILLPWLLGMHNLQLLRPLSTLFLLGFTAYGMIKFRLMDIRLMVTRTVAYFLLILFIGFLVASGLYAFSVLVIGQSIEKSQIYISILLVLFILFAFPTFNRFFEKITDRLFYKGRYETATLLRKLSLITASTLSLDDLIKSVLTELKQNIKVTAGSVLLIKDSQVLGVKTIQEKQSFFQNKKEMAEFLKTIKNENKILVFDELGEGEIKKVFRKFGVRVSIPLQVRGEKVGFLLLGEKASGEIFSAQDIAVFEILGPELAVAVQNALAYEEIRRFNITLREEIKKATRELRRANERLKGLDRLKDEFLSVATHELRTPMTAVKGYIDMILSGDTGRINQKTKEFLSEAYEVTDRLAKLVNDMLDVSLIEQKRLTLEIKEIDLSDQVKKIVGQLAPLAKEKGLSLTYKPPKKPLFVKADSAKVSQILHNLIGNAIKFTKEGGVTITHEESDDYIVTRIKDTGVGISKADKDKLFHKFTRIDEGRKREQGGTGLGLYISKGLVENMGGEIWVQSKLNKGSTFIFSLPKAK